MILFVQILGFIFQQHGAYGMGRGNHVANLVAVAFSDDGTNLESSGGSIASLKLQEMRIQGRNNQDSSLNVVLILVR